MSWRMPAETARHDRTWMAFPAEGQTLGETAAEREEGYATWTAVAHAVAEFEPVSMLVDPAEVPRARRMLSGSIDLIEAPVDEFWMRDSGPTFVVDDARPDVLGAVDWIFNGWGAPDWAEWHKAAEHARIVTGAVGAELVSSTLVNEGGGIHVDGEGTVLLTDTVQLDPRRNPFADRSRVEAEMARTLGATKAIWLPRGLTRDYDDFGTNGHVDIVATLAAPGRLLLHDQRNPEHPDHAVSRELRAHLEQQTDAAGRRLDVVSLPAPTMLRDNEGFVDWSYVNHLVTNDGVIACGFGDERADAEARDLLAGAYPGRRVVSVDARPLFDRGGGIHCITQQQPALPSPGR
ncbi:MULTISPECIES: agmatine/peptidylarginine deiminase [unclassified Microbacterium]|uniref:agmatine deiminase family protein n=1 Tax=unclassified Microbacterium TaxID=2609290 RepID=UPI000EAA5851|nr:MULTISPECIES: agmatine deiminase family protein [unclassified Microbacterium]MBT2483449.1 agmatine deiminase family protein [Microbacterium sp. ISL-108]RKN66474.1 agmatine deiminase family protein [Microbacterium sp. CGR2]